MDETKPLLGGFSPSQLSVRDKYLSKLGYFPLRFREEGPTPSSLLRRLPSTDPSLTPVRRPKEEPRPRGCVPWVKYMLRPGSTATSVFNLCSATLGAGALSLPYAVSLCGIILGFILLLLGGLLTVYSIHLLLHIRSKTRLASYEDLATQAFSSKGAIFVEVNIILFCFGTCVAYIVTLSDIICPVLELFLPHSFFTSRAFVVIALTIFVLFPISLIEKMSSLAFASFLGVFAIVYLVATVSAFSIDYSIDYGFQC